MRIRYYISAKKNLLYGNRYYYQGRFKSYGQHSFIHDFVVQSFAWNVTVDLIVDGLTDFPIYKLLEPYCNLYEWKEANDVLSADIAVIDVINENMVSLLPKEIPKVCIVHNAGTVFDKALIECCNFFVCMTETALEFQSKRIKHNKLVLITQGVDLNRFKFYNNNGRTIRDILVFTRMNHEKRHTLLSVLNELKQRDYYVTVVGDGPLFWEISDAFGEKFVIINYIPYHSIPIFLQRFDLVLSSGRGVMEACATGKPTICAGLGYGGLIKPDNVNYLLKRNLTGYGESFTRNKFEIDLNAAIAASPSVWRQIAESYFDANKFIEKILFQMGEIAREEDSSYLL